MKRIISVIFLTVLVFGNLSFLSAQNLVDDVLWLKKNGITDNVINKYVDMRLNEIPVEKEKLIQPDDMDLDEKTLLTRLDKIIKHLIYVNKSRSGIRDSLRVMGFPRMTVNKFLLINPKLKNVELGRIYELKAQNKSDKYIFSIIMRDRYLLRNASRKKVVEIKSGFSKGLSIGIPGRHLLPEIKSPEKPPGFFRKGLSASFRSVSPYVNMGICLLKSNYAIDGLFSFFTGKRLKDILSDEYRPGIVKPGFSINTGVNVLLPVYHKFKDRYSIYTGAGGSFSYQKGEIENSVLQSGDYWAHIIEVEILSGIYYILNSSVAIDLRITYSHGIKLRNTVLSADGENVILDNIPWKKNQTYLSISCIYLF